MKFFKIFLITIIFSMHAFAVDVVYLKNGDVFRGEIIEQKMNEYLQIKTLDHNEKRITWDQIDKIIKEELKLSEKDKLILANTSNSSKTPLRNFGRGLFWATYAGTVAYTLGRKGTATAIIPVIGPVAGISPLYSSSEKTLSYVSMLFQSVGLIIWASNEDSDSVAKPTAYFVPSFDENRIAGTFSFNF
ncbi:MAG: hypothetical protein H7281_17840 [Bacteriovorax sp.]|nr:hypothetical protein [Bacteriovorax sp.]